MVAVSCEGNSWPSNWTIPRFRIIRLTTTSGDRPSVIQNFLLVGTTPRNKSTPPDFCQWGSASAIQEEYRDEVSKIRRYFGGFRYFHKLISFRTKGAGKNCRYFQG